MNNNVVLGIVFWLQRLKVTTLRFDFCGIQIGRGHRQVEQVKEAADFLLHGQFSHTSNPPNRILLVGYSYGSIITASASSSIPECIGAISIAPPLAVRHWMFFFHGNYHLDQAKKRQNLPQLMIMGSDDNFTSESCFMSIVKTMPQKSTTGAVLKGADHFFRGREKDLMDVLGTSVPAVYVYEYCLVALKSICIMYLI